MATITVTATDYSGMFDTLQTVIYNIVSGDSTVTGIIPKVVDGIPTKLTRATGGNYISIRTPATDEERLTQGYTMKLRNELTISIEVVSREESMVRTCADAVHNILKTSQNTTRAASFTLYNIGRSTISEDVVAKEGVKGERTQYMMTLFVSYTFIGD